MSCFSVPVIHFTLHVFTNHFSVVGLSQNLGRSSCVSNPCAEGSSCIQSSNVTQHYCVEPTSQQCTFDDGLCAWIASNGTEVTHTEPNGTIGGNMPFYDHTMDNCSGKKGDNSRLTDSSLFLSFILKRSLGIASLEGNMLQLQVRFCEIFVLIACPQYPLLL